MGAVETSPHAESVPFDNSANGFTADRVQPAIEEARNTAQGKARWTLSCGFDGNASPTRWLEFATNVASNLTPYVFPGTGLLVDLTMGTNGNSTCTITIYKNGVAITTISTVNQSAKVLQNLNIALVSGDKISAAVTSGSAARPMLYPHFRLS